MSIKHFKRPSFWLRFAKCRALLQKSSSMFSVHESVRCFTHWLQSASISFSFQLLLMSICREEMVVILLPRNIQLLFGLIESMARQYFPSIRRVCVCVYVVYVKWKVPNSNALKCVGWPCLWQLATVDTYWKIILYSLIFDKYASWIRFTSIYIRWYVPLVLPHVYIAQSQFDNDKWQANFLVALARYKEWACVGKISTPEQYVCAANQCHSCPKNQPTIAHIWAIYKLDIAFVGTKYTLSMSDIDKRQFIIST